MQSGKIDCTRWTLCSQSNFHQVMLNAMQVMSSHILKLYSIFDKHLLLLAEHQCRLYTNIRNNSSKQNWNLYHFTISHKMSIKSPKNENLIICLFYLAKCSHFIPLKSVIVLESHRMPLLPENKQTKWISHAIHSFCVLLSKFVMLWILSIRSVFGCQQIRNKNSKFDFLVKSFG